MTGATARKQNPYRPHNRVYRGRNRSFEPLNPACRRSISSRVAEDVLSHWYRRASRGLELVDDGLESHHARWMVVLSLGTWLPLIALAAFSGVLNGEPRFAALIADLPVHARLLLAIPLLIDAATRSDCAVAAATRLGIERVTVPEDLDKLRRALARLERGRRSWIVVVVTAALAVGGGVRLAHLALSSPASNWLRPDVDQWLSLPGLWYCAICAPIFFFLLMRVAWRWLLWTIVVVRTSLLRLTVVPSHGDSAGGLGVIGVMPLRFTSAVAAVSLVVGMTWLKQVLFHGAHAQQYARPAAGLLVLMLLLFFSPPLVFVPQLTRLKLRALHDFGELVFHTNATFERRWVSPGADPDGLLKTGEASTVTDLGQVYTQVERMWVFPFRRSAFIGVVAAVVLPLLPVVIAELGVRDLLKELLGALL